MLLFSEDNFEAD